MYKKGDYVIHKSRGLCRIFDISTLDIENVDRNRLYYFMTPENSSACRIYVPVESEQTTLRKPISKNEALRLIDGLPDLDEVKISEEKQRENVYRSAIVNEDCQSLFQVIRTTYLRKEDRIAHGRKCTAVDEKYQRAAEDILYSELSYSLNIQKDQVKDFITDRIGSLK